MRFLEKKYVCLFGLLSMLPCSLGFCQELKLLPFDHGMNLIYGKNVTKEMIIDDTRFAEGEDHVVDILRIDNVGARIAGQGPMLISSKTPVRVDSLGSTRLKLRADTLSRIIEYIVRKDTKIYRRVLSQVLFRITYRSNGFIGQYYVANLENATVFFQELDQRIQLTKCKEMRSILFSLLSTSLILDTPENGKPKWRFSK